MHIKRRYWPAGDPADRLGTAAARALSVFSIMACAVGSALTAINLRYLPEEWFVVALGGLVALICGLAPAMINTGRAGFAWRARLLGGLVIAGIIWIALMNGKVPQVSNVILVPIVLTFTLILGARDGAVAAAAAMATQAAVWFMYVQSGAAPHWTTQLAAGMIASTAFAWAGAAVFRHEMSKAMAALAEEKRRAEAADRAKSAFLANMSHEIRTPLNGVLGMADVLSRTDLDEAQQRSVALIRTSGDSLLGLLNDILDLSRVEAGRLELERAPFSLEALLHHVCDSVRPRFEAKGVALELKIDPQLAAARPRLGDRLRLMQVIANLVSNAEKFTRKGSVVLSAAPGEGADTVMITVADTGCGMSAEELGRVFEPFAQADISTTRRHGGAGLGLSIVLRLVDLMDGSLDAQSTPGAGSTFTVRLALPRADTGAEDGGIADGASVGNAAASHAPAGALALKGLRVLVVDDSETNRLVAAGLLRPLEAKVTLASNGREAVSRFDEGAFDLVLMDIRMPEMDGLAALRAIRAKPDGAHTPVIAMTANVMDFQVRAYEAEGFDAVLAKPLRPEQITDALCAALSPRRGAA